MDILTCVWVLAAALAVAYRDVRRNGFAPIAARCAALRKLSPDREL